MGAVAFGLPEFKTISVLASDDDLGLKYCIEAKFPPNHCEKCGAVGTPYVHGSKIRLIRDLPISDKQVVLEVKVKRYKCSECGQTFFESFKSIDETGLTTRLRKRIAERVLRRDTFTKVATDYSVSDKTVRRVFDEWAAAHAYLLNYETPRVLGLDEAHIDDQFRLVATDIEKRIPIEMLPNNKFKTVVKFLKELPNRNNIKVVTMDFCETYSNAVIKALPDRPLIVIDRFHVIQLLNRRMDSVRKRINAEERRDNPQKGLKLKRERTLFMANLDDLDDDALTALSGWLTAHPLLEEVYILKERFREVYEFHTRTQAEEAFDEWCAAVPDYIPEFVSLRDVYMHRREHILNFFDGRYTNAFTESANNILKDIEKRGRGYNFETLRMIMLLSFKASAPGTFDPKDTSFAPSHEF